MKLLSIPITIVFLVFFYLTLLIFHPLQWLGLKIGGYEGHRRIVNAMNWCLTKCLLLLGVTVRFDEKHKLPEDATLIIVANHQGIFDIPPLSWHFRKYHPKFVSKIELATGTPSVSFNLRHGGSVLIDRKNGKQAIMALSEFATKINKNKWSAVIFPEGTRSRNGVPKEFAASGVKMLTKKNPEGYVVPVTINNCWKIFKWGKFPLGIFCPITFTVHEAIQVNSMPFDELFAKVESQIKEHIKY